MVYDPKTPGLDPSVQRELQEIRSEFERSQVEFIEFRVHNAAPSKPKQGRAYYADGTNWNPGSGKGLYSYDGSGWVFLEDQDTAPSTATTSAEGVVELATSAEAQAGTDTARVITAETLRDSIVSGTAVATTSGTSIDFTSIPSWVKRITVMLEGVSTSGTSNPVFRIGDSGGIETTGYAGSAGYYTASAQSTSVITAGFGCLSATAAADLHGRLTLELIDASTNTWLGTSIFGRTNSAIIFHGSATKSLSGTLDRVRITTGGGTDTFDAGTMNIIYE